MGEFEAARPLATGGRANRSDCGTWLPGVPRQRSRWRRMDLSPILVGEVSLRSHGRSIHRPAARDLRQQAPERGKRTNADLRLGCEAQRHAGLWLEHPGRHLKASASIPIEAAPQRGATSSLGHLMDMDRETAPGMPRIQQPPFRGPVGVQSSSCTMGDSRTRAWVRGRQNRLRRCLGIDESSG